MTSKTDPASTIDASPRLKLFELLTGHYVSQALYVAARLGIADLLAEGPRTSAELAQATKTHAPSLNRLLRLLASSGVLTETDADTFGLTPVGAYLRRNHPDGSSHAVALLFAGPIMRAWNDLLYSVETGEPAFERVFGMKVFEYMPKHPEDAAVFNEAMTGVSAQTASNVPAAYDFSGVETLVDAGGGHGVLLAMILKDNPRLKGILFELPHVAEGARKNLAALGLSDRCEVVAGDFFESVPPADAYILKSVIHDWDREKSVKILGNCRRAMKTPGKLLLVELVLPARIDHSLRSFIGTGSDINMLVNAGGRERTDADFAELFQSAGFKLTRIIPVEGSLASVLEGVPV